MMNEQRSGRPGQAILTAWLGASHLLAAAGAAGAVLLAPATWAPIARLGAALVVGATLGLLLSQPLTGALQVAAAALAALARGQAIAALPQDRPRRWGPLGDLLGQVDALAAREREVAALRADLVRSTGQAAVQAERNRLARELHDSIKQQLYAINVSAAAALARWESDLVGARNAVEDVRRSAQAALTEMAALLQQLRPAPLAAAGLLDALREQSEALAHRTGARVTVDLGQPEDAAAYAAAVDTGRLAPGAEEEIFRIGQEALNNVARHARAGNVDLRLRIEDEVLKLDITDDGQGFSAPETEGADVRGDAGYGLAGMRDRAAAIGATLDLTSAPGKGTHVALAAPLGKPAAVLQEEAEMSAQLKSAMQKVSLWQSVGMAAALFGLVVAQGMIPRLTGRPFSGPEVIFGVGWLVVCAIGGRVAWSRARSAALSVTLAHGADSPAVWLMRRESAASRVWVALAAIVIVPGALMPKSYAQYPIAALAVGAACAVFAVITLLQSYRATEGYWSRLGSAALTEEIDRAWQQRFSWVVVLAITTVGYFGLYGGFQAAWAWPPSRDLVLDLTVTLFLVLLVVTFVIGYLQLRSWRARTGGAPRRG